MHFPVLSCFRSVFSRVCVQACLCMQKLNKSVRSIRDGFTGIYKLPEMNSGNWTLAHLINTKWSQSLFHLFSFRPSDIYRTTLYPHNRHSIWNEYPIHLVFLHISDFLLLALQHACYMCMFLYPAAEKEPTHISYSLIFCLHLMLRFRLCGFSYDKKHPIKL